LEVKEDRDDSHELKVGPANQHYKSGTDLDASVTRQGGGKKEATVQNPPQC